MKIIKSLTDIASGTPIRDIEVYDLDNDGDKEIVFTTGNLNYKVFNVIGTSILSYDFKIDQRRRNMLDFIP